LGWSALGVRALVKTQKSKLFDLIDSEHWIPMYKRFWHRLRKQNALSRRHVLVEFQVIFHRFNGKCISVFGCASKTCWKFGKSIPFVKSLEDQYLPKELLKEALNSACINFKDMKKLLDYCFLPFFDKLVYKFRSYYGVYRWGNGQELMKTIKKEVYFDDFEYAVMIKDGGVWEEKRFD
jgi:hypothetical protein